MTHNAQPHALRYSPAVLSCLVLPCVGAQGPPAFTVDEMLKLKRVSDPQLSPDGTRIAFVVTDVSLDANTRNNDIWVVPAAGGAPVKLVGTDRSEDRPRWSPDGKRLAFVSNREGGPQVWVIPAAGGEAEEADDDRDRGLGRHVVAGWQVARVRVGRVPGVRGRGLQRA